MKFKRRMYIKFKMFQQKSQKNLPLKTQEQKCSYRQFRRRQG